MRHFKSFVIAIAAMMGMSAPAAAQLRVTVVGEEYVPMRIAVPDFDSEGTGAAEIAAQLSDVLRKDLASSAVFELVDKAAFIGSTLALLNYVKRSTDKTEFIVTTEVGILHQMQRARPDARFVCSPPNSGCDCAMCPYMRLNTLEKLYLCLRDREPELLMDEAIRVRALKPVERMLELSAQIAAAKSGG